MRIEDFRRLFGGKPFILDGASGTHMIDMGMPPGVCPEKWASQNLDKLSAMHASYIEAGSQAVYAFTFGANRYKLAEYGLGDEMHDINMRNCEAACEAAMAKGALVGGDMSPIGQFVQPLGEMEFDRAVEIHYEHAQVLAQAGADFLIIETMLDIQDVRAAVIGAREACSLPVAVTMTFDESGHTLTGSSPETVAVTLCALGVDAIGANCGIGPGAMIPVIEQLNRFANIPIMAKPNAGLPTGDTMPVDEYAADIVKLVEAGASAVGGCCGTGFAHIAEIKRLVKDMDVKPWGGEFRESKLCSMSNVANIRDGAFCSIGEKINPTGRKPIQEALKSGDMETIIGLAADQKADGANVVDLNVGMAGIDEAAMLKQVMHSVAARVDIPVSLDSTNINAIESALREYPGRALLNSVSAEKGRPEALLPIVARYGCMYIALPVGEDGVPESSAGRIACIEKILALADELGLPRGRAIVDVLALAIGSMPDAGMQALDVVRWCREQGLNCMIGTSNISFGLPDRRVVTTTMLTAAMTAGVQAAIIDVCDPPINASIEATRAILYGGGLERYTSLYTAGSEEEGLYGAILSGEKGSIDSMARQLLEEGVKPEQIVDEHVIPALDKVGELFAEKELFLPHLMASAEAAKQCFGLLEPLMEQRQEAKATAVIATVKGDIHDIGKNIVALMLRNHGFNVIDMGRDVDNDDILDTAQRENAEIIGLSALITTTMPRMGECAEMMRQRNMECVLMVGGAVVTSDYARSIGALYSRDAAEAVEVAKKAVEGRGGLE